MPPARRWSHKALESTLGLGLVLGGWGSRVEGSGLGCRATIYRVQGCGFCILPSSSQNRRPFSAVTPQEEYSYTLPTCHHCFPLTNWLTVSLTELSKVLCVYVLVELLTTVVYARHVYTRVYIHTHRYVHVYIQVYVCIHVCTYYIYIHVQTMCKLLEIKASHHSIAVSSCCHPAQA